MSAAPPTMALAVAGLIAFLLVVLVLFYAHGEREAAARGEVNDAA